MNKYYNINLQICNLITSINNGSQIAIRYPSIKKTMTDIYDLIEDKDYRITVVGEFSAGKSTFLNALIGRDILPHGVTETTAAITYIHNVPINATNCDTAVVHFSDDSKGDEVLKLKDNSKQLIEYVTTSAAQNVVTEIESVDIYIHFLDSDDKVILVDTPGMNGVKDGHKELTMKEIKRSHASICLFHLRGIGKTDLEFLKQLMGFQDTFFFVVNSIDQLNKSDGETYESRIGAFKEEIKQFVYDGKNEPKYVYGVSALNALASRDLTIKKVYENDSIELTPERRKICWDISKFSTFEHDLYNFLKDDAKELDFYKLAVKKIESELEHFKEITTQNYNLLKTTVENSPEKKELLEARKSVQDSIEINLRKIKDRLGADFDDVEHNSKNKVKKECEKEIGTLKKEIDLYNTLESIKNIIKNNDIPRKIKNFYDIEKSNLSKDINKELEDIYFNSIKQIQHYMPGIEMKGEKAVLRPSIQFDEEAICSYNDRLSELEKRKRQLEKEAQQKDVLWQNTKKEISAIDKDIKEITNYITELTYEKQRKLNSIGSRPAIRERTEVYYQKEEGVVHSLFRLLSLGFYKGEKEKKKNSQR